MCICVYFTNSDTPGWMGLLRRGEKVLQGGQQSPTRLELRRRLLRRPFPRLGRVALYPAFAAAHRERR